MTRQQSQAISFKSFQCIQLLDHIFLSDYYKLHYTFNLPYAQIYKWCLTRTTLSLSLCLSLSRRYCFKFLRKQILQDADRFFNEVFAGVLGPGHPAYMRRFAAESYAYVMLLIRGV